MSAIVVSNYPLSDAFRVRIERQFGGGLRYVQLPELRKRSMGALLALLRRVDTTNFVIAFETETAKSLLPVFFLMAAVSNAKQISVVDSDGSRRVSRWELPSAASSFLAACVAGQLSVLSANRDLAVLENAPLRTLSEVTLDGVLYLNTSSLLGAQAGGALGHIAGVVNGFSQVGVKPSYWYAVEGPLVRGEVARVRYEIPSFLGFPAEANHYRISRSLTAQLARNADGASPGFVYQRLTIGNYAGAVISRRRRIPLVTEYNGSEVWIARNWGSGLRYSSLAARAEDVMLRRSSLVVTISEVLAEELVSRGLESRRVVWYPNCIDETVFDPSKFSDASTRDLRASLGIAPQAIVAGFVGTFAQWHGVEVLADAIAVARADAWKSRAGRDVHFLLIGDGVLMPRVRQIVAEAGAEAHVTFTGIVPQREAPRYLRAADILLSPHVGNADGTRFFGSPTKLFEYMAMGRPIVASRIEQLAQVLRGSDDGDAPNAVLVTPREPKALWMEIRELADAPDRREALASAARRDVLERYRWQDHVRVIMQRLRELRSENALWA